MPNESDSFLVRFMSKGPSVLDYAVRDDAPPDSLEALVLELEPRDRDEGWSSFWERQTEFQEKCVKAGFAAQRGKRDKLTWLRFPQELAQRYKIRITVDTRPETFECITDLHRLAALEDESLRRQLAEAIVSFLREYSENYGRITKGQIGAFVAGVYRQCVESGATVNLNKADEWVRQYVPDSPD